MRAAHARREVHFADASGGAVNRLLERRYNSPAWSSGSSVKRRHVSVRAAHPHCCACACVRACARITRAQPSLVGACVVLCVPVQAIGRADARRDRNRLRYRPAAHLPPREGSPRAPRHHHCACTDARTCCCARVGVERLEPRALNRSASTAALAARCAQAPIRVIGREALLCHGHTAYVGATHTCHTTNTRRTRGWDRYNVQPQCGAPMRTSTATRFVAAVSEPSGSDARTGRQLRRHRLQHATCCLASHREAGSGLHLERGFAMANPLIIEHQFGFKAFGTSPSSLVLPPPSDIHRYGRGVRLNIRLSL